MRTLAGDGVVYSSFVYSFFYVVYIVILQCYCL